MREGGREGGDLIVGAALAVPHAVDVRQVAVLGLVRAEDDAACE